MRLLELRLDAFGPFTGRRLDLSAGEPGLHVVFGQNEAGKSSALRALTALLYGIETRTQDGFLHELAKLRVGGRLRLADGRELDFCRRKGAKRTLLAADGATSLADEALAPFLGSVTEDLFRSVFGIDHARLVAGGQDLLAQDGEVGKALFSAAQGVPHLHELLARLDEEADELFRPRGHNQKVNKLLADLHSARDELRAAALAAKDHEGHRTALEEAAAGLAGVQAALDAARRESSALQRLLRLRPSAARRRELLAQVAALGQVHPLPADSGSRRLAFQKARDAAVASLAEDRAKAEQLRARITLLVPQGALLREALAIRDLHQGLGSYEKARADRPTIDGKRQQARNDARDRLKGLRPDLKLDDLPALRPAIATARRPVMELANGWSALDAALRAARRTAAAKEAEARELRAALPDGNADAEAGPLERAVQAARRRGDLDALRDEARRAEARARDRCAEDLAALGLVEGPLEAVVALPVPPEAAVDRFEGELLDLAERRRALAAEAAQVARDLADQDRELEEARLAGAVPLEEDLTAARRGRDALWSLVRRAWERGEDVATEAGRLAPSAPLAEAFEGSVARSDEVADRLRREADRVARQARLVADRARREGDRRALAEGEAQALAAERAALEAWTALWSPAGLTPWPPREMRAWLARLADLRREGESLAQAVAASAALAAAADEHRASLASRLGLPLPADERVAPLLEAADARLDAMKAAATRRRDLARVTRELERAAADQETAAADLATWQERWTSAVAALGLPATATASQAQGVLEEYGGLFEALDEADALDRRVYGIDRDLEEYAAGVARFVDQVAPDCADGDPRRAVLRLQQRLDQATAEASERAALEKQVVELEVRRAAAEAKRGEAEAGLAGLCAEARCAGPEGLEEAERRSSALQKLRDQLAEVEPPLAAESDGAGLQELVDRILAADADQVAARVEGLTARIGELEAERVRLAERKGAEEAALRGMTGGSAAAEAAARLQALAAAARRDAEHWLRLTAAALLLRGEIERYRATHQDPVLRRAGELFARLTGGSFQGLRSEFAADDEPRLAGVRPSGASVGVEGMSSGTRDQLYLGLRLALLERYLAAAEPMPFVVDDVLVNFDDPRARATLEVLADLGATTQVLLFTHHERIRAQADDLGPARRTFVHELSPA